eukprot:TRINITY_DN910_c0_g2_i3.p2 TRINITY_DN910_c0_g2~~TRINITY_DN910_c0_g2_i3.p2  ORF type:complete len:263 (-),score=69.84 TRINITY_DN910_c0_g2_i3:89-877(-)
MVIMGGFEDEGYIDIENFKKNSGGKSKKSPNQMSGKKARNILAGYSTTIVPYLKVKGDNLNHCTSLLECITIIQFLAYSNFETLSIPGWRIQIWIYAFVERVLLKKVFGVNVKEYITLHTHGITGHLAPYTEIVVKEQRAPIQNSTEIFESQFSKQNKINTNKQVDTLAVNWIESAMRNVFISKDINRPRSGETNLHHITSWTKNYKWKTVSLPLDNESKALIKILKENNYQENEHWVVASNSVLFRPPPAKNTTREVLFYV